MAPPPEFIGQSFEAWRDPLRAALRARQRATVLTCAHRQVDAGARSLDLNLGAHPDAGAMADLPWLVATLRSDPSTAQLPLCIDIGDPRALLQAVSPLTGAHGLVLNAVPLGAPEADPLLAAAAAAGWGVVLSPRLFDPAPGGPTDPVRLADVLSGGAKAARRAGITAPVYLDALAYPPASDAGRASRSLVVLRRLRDDTLISTYAAQTLVAVGNTAHGIPPALRPAMRELYAAAAAGAGARALLLPVEEQGTCAAATGEATGPHGRWLAAIMAAARTGAPLPEPLLTGSDWGWTDTAQAERARHSHAVWELLTGGRSTGP